ncbi:ion channel [Halalkalibacterium halodurans]|uniref:ion channel n=2 Tax=Halalkalibacterium halodurans TaxID=86665 RepID=UPI002E206E52|nr:ion channel [Halalkalibacterium halodurans]
MMISLIKKVLRHSIRIEHWKIILFGILFILISSFVIHWIEPEEFKSPYIGFWFVMTTVSQVGFGDYIPETVAGRLFTTVIYLFGISFFAVMIAKWIDFIQKYEELKEDNSMVYQGKNHVVMITWSEKAKLSIMEILNEKKTTKIVVIDERTDVSIDDANVYYVQGDPSKVDILEKANVLQAKTVCLFASDYPVDATAEDGKVLLIASTIKQMAKMKNTDPYIVCEILDEDHINNGHAVWVDDYILSHKPFSKLMATTALSEK